MIAKRRLIFRYDRSSAQAAVREAKSEARGNLKTSA